MIIITIIIKPFLLELLVTSLTIDKNVFKIPPLLHNLDYNKIYKYLYIRFF